MKTLLFAAFFSVIAFSSCQKDNNDTVTGPNLSASFDGSSKKFNNALVGSVTSTDGSYGLQVIGFAGTAGTSDALYLSILKDGPIVPGTYIEGQGAGITYVSQTGGVTNYSNALSATNPISITITSISSTKVTGTFTGDIFIEANSTLAKKVLANGQFNVTLKQ
jgi:hypothetical protein